MCWVVMQNNTANTLIKHMAQTKVPLLLLKDKKVTWFKHVAWAQKRLHKAEAALTKKTEKIQEKKNHLHVEDRDCSHLFTVFFLNPLCNSIPPPLHPPPIPLKAITEIQFLIPPHRSSIDCKQIYIQAVNRKLQRFIYWVWRRETS